MYTKKLQENTIFDYSIIATLIIAIPLILFLFISPRNNKFFNLSQENEKLEQELIIIRSSYKTPILQANARAKHINEKTKKNWEKIKAAIKQLNNLSADDTFRSINEDAIIDYKISLFNTDLMLREEAAAYSMILPDSIGLPEEVEDDQNIEVLFDQLSIINKLTRLTMKSGVQEITSIECYPPKDYPLIEEENAIVTEFPIKINIAVSYKELINLLINFNKTGTFIAVSEIEILKADRFNKDILYVDLMCSSFGFNDRRSEDNFINKDTVIEYLKDEEEIIDTTIPGTRRGRTRGREQ
jgi:hypothetical protein